MLSLFFNSHYLATSERRLLLSIILLFYKFFIVISMFWINIKALAQVIPLGSTPSLEVKKCQIDLLFLLKIKN